MLQKMSNLDYHFLVPELRQLEGAHLNQVYELEKGLFRFKFRKDSESNFVVELGVRAHFTKFLPESPKQAPQFAMLLRKHLDNARVLEADQKNFDRLLTLSFGKGDGYELVFELFAKGNVILCKDDFTIIRAYRKEKSTNRSIEPFSSYAPPGLRPPLASLSEKIFEGAKGSVLKFLSQSVALPPFYLQEALFEAGVGEKADCGRVSEEQGRKIVDACKSMPGRNVEPVVYFEGGKPVAFSAFPLKRFSQFESKQFPAFSEALDEYYQNAARESQQQPKLKTDNPELGKLQHSLNEQKAALEAAERQEVEARKAAEAIYSNYEKVVASLEVARKEGKKGKISVEL